MLHMSLIEIAHCQTRNTAEVHDTRNTEVQIAGLLGQNLTESSEHDNCTENDSRLKKLRNLYCCDHLTSPPFFPRTMIR